MGMGNDDYAREKFGVAVDGMATSACDIRDRLEGAYLSFHPVRAEDFTSKENSDLYRKVMEKLTAVKDGPTDNGHVKNTLSAMTDGEAESVASDIFELYSSLMWDRIHAGS